LFHVDRVYAHPASLLRSRSFWLLATSKIKH
jgi:hypothetical protein